MIKNCTDVKMIENGGNYLSILLCKKFVSLVYCTVEVPNSQRISCLDSSLGRASACGAGGGGARPARDVFVSALS
jgi:hypothetical protein